MHLTNDGVLESNIRGICDECDDAVSSSGYVVSRGWRGCGRKNLCPN